MLDEFITQPDGAVSLEDYQTALDEVLRLRKRLTALEQAAREYRDAARDDYDESFPVDKNYNIVPIEDSVYYLTRLQIADRKLVALLKTETTDANTR